MSRLITETLATAAVASTVGWAVIVIRAANAGDVPARVLLAALLPVALWAVVTTRVWREECGS